MSYARFSVIVSDGWSIANATCLTAAPGHSMTARGSCCWLQCGLVTGIQGDSRTVGSVDSLRRLSILCEGVASIQNNGSRRLRYVIAGDLTNAHEETASGCLLKWERDS